MNTTARTDQAQTDQPDDHPISEHQSRELRRPIDGRMAAGVAAGLADYLRVDVTLVRIALAVLVLVGGSGVALYLAGWLLIPEEGAELSIAADLIGQHR
jgi:phage shock protein C